MNDKKHYIYLVKNKKHTQFKIGRSFTKNIKLRLKQYNSHNPDIDIIGWWIVNDSKKYEKLIQLKILKIGFVLIKNKKVKEWFSGNIFTFEIEQMIKEIQEREKLYNV